MKSVVFALFFLILCGLSSQLEAQTPAPSGEIEIFNPLDPRLLLVVPRVTATAGFQRTIPIVPGPPPVVPTPIGSSVPSYRPTYIVPIPPGATRTPAFSQTAFRTFIPFPPPGVTRTPIFQRTRTPIFGGTRTPIFGRTGTPIFGRTGTPIFGRTATPIFGRTRTPIFQRTSTPIAGRTGTPVFDGTNTPIFGRTSTPIFPRTRTPIFIPNRTRTPVTPGGTLTPAFTVLPGVTVTPGGTQNPGLTPVTTPLPGATTFPGTPIVTTPQAGTPVAGATQTFSSGTTPGLGTSTPGASGTITPAAGTATSLPFETPGQTGVSSAATQSIVMPYLDCVYNLQDGSYLAYFGYENFSGSSIQMPPGDWDGMTNRLYPNSYAQAQVINFKPGRVRGAFAVRFDGYPLEWRLSYPGYSVQSVIATESSAACEPVLPHAECLMQNQNSQLAAVFGYQNNNEFDLLMPVGSFNTFSPLAEDKSQPEIFFRGRVNNVFSVPFEGNQNLNWRIGGRTAIADSSTPYCSDYTASKYGGARPPVPGTTYVESTYGCSQTYTAESVTALNEAITTQFVILSQHISASNADAANDTLARIRELMASMPASITNCADSTNCQRIDLSPRTEQIRTYSESLRRQTAYMLRQTEARKYAAGRRYFTDSRIAYNYTIETLATLPRFYSKCE